MTPLAIAINRFGLGYRQGDELPSDPKGWLRNQIAAYKPYLGEMAQADYGAGRVRQLVAEVEATRVQRRDLTQSGVDNKEEDLKAVTAALQKQVKTIYNTDVATRMRAAVDTPTPFMERMVHFWSNHFTVSTGRKRIANLVGTYEFGAIRPHITGNFADLLRAASLHPAMLFYLDQPRSIGPGSALLGGRKGAKRGLNENLGREILELHTLGVAGGYTQTDVLELSRALTGWVVIGAEGEGTGARPTSLGAAFNASQHEPGTRTLMGRTYPQRGENQARAILDDLAVHPATARHIATKLARHFAGDTPPPAMVERIAKRFIESRGNLAQVYQAIIDSPEAWVDKPIKVRQPWEWTAALLRAAGDQVVKDWRLAQVLDELGQSTWGANSPAGWDDRNDAWLGPDALLRRVRAAETISDKTRLTDVRALAQQMYPQSLSANTEAYLRGAESNQMALALLAVSPEMLRR